MSIFLDTGVIAAWYNKRDPLHPQAAELIASVSKGAFGAVYTSEYIFDEVLALVFARTGNMNSSKDLAKKILSSEGTELLPVDAAIFRDSVGQYLAQDGELSFTDCTTVELMKQNEITYLATFDNGFKSITGIKVVS